MNYTFKTDISSEEYMRFLHSLPHYNIMQTPMWAEVKTGWSHTICGLYSAEKIVAACLLLIRRLPLGIKLIYSPRGLLLDYDNAEHLREFTRGLKNYAKSIGAYVVRIDPEIVISKTYKGQCVEKSEGYAILEKIKSVGFLHMGFAKDFHTYTQPRFNAEYSVADEKSRPLTDEEILSGFDKKIKKFIGEYTENRGIYFESSVNADAVGQFAAISERTEERQGILLRDQGYFERIKQAFKDDNVFFFAKMNLDKFLEFSEEQLKKGINPEQAGHDIAEAKKIEAEKGNIVTLSALLTIKSNDTAYLMYSGFDYGIFPRFRTTNQLRFEAMKYFRERGCKIFSFMGVDGNLSDPLSEFKLRFNPYIVEYAGEFELPVKRLTYSFMNRFFPLLKRIYIRSMLVIKGRKKQ